MNKYYIMGKLSSIRKETSIKARIIRFFLRQLLKLARKGK